MGPAEHAVNLRTAQIEDAASLAALSIEVWVGTYLRQGVNTFFAQYVLDTYTPAYFETVLGSAQDHIIVSQNQEGLDGFIRLTRNAPGPVEGGPDTEITTLYVQPRHHGKGIGLALLNAGRAWCLHKGISAVWLATNAENTPAIGFYRAQGFRAVGETHFRVQDQAYPNTVFVADLS